MPFWNGGVKVTLAVYSPEVLSQLMEPQDASLIRQALDDAGLFIITGVAATGIVTDASGVTGVALNDGRETALRDGLHRQRSATQRGISGRAAAFGWKRGLWPTAIPPPACWEPLQAGDVAVTYEPVTGKPVMTALWTNAVEMGRCAGLNMAGHRTAYSGTFGILNATQVGGATLRLHGDRSYRQRRVV